MKSAVRIIGIIIVVSLVCYLFGISSVCATEQYLLGDADGDGKVMIVDCTLIQRDIVGLAEIESYNRCAADVDSDGEICILDATAIQRYLAEMNDNYPIGEYISDSGSTLSHYPTVSVSGKTVTVDDVAFDTALIPDRTTISDSKTNSKTLILCTKANLAPEDKAALTAVNNCERIRIEVNAQAKAILVVPVTIKDRDNVRWTKSQKEPAPRKIECVAFASQLYKIWNWNREETYRATGRVVKADKKVMLLFDFTKPEKWVTKARKEKSVVNG